MSDNVGLLGRRLKNTSYKEYPFTFYNKMDFIILFSGSTNYNTMIICPCSMGTLGRIAVEFQMI